MPQPAEPAQDRDALFAQRPAGAGQRRQQRAGGDRGRPLNIVVERAELVAITLQQRARVGLGEVLPLEQDAGEFLFTACTNASTKSS